jgi:hypothetical protein
MSSRDFGHCTVVISHMQVGHVELDVVEIANLERIGGSVEFCPDA